MKRVSMRDPCNTFLDFWPFLSFVRVFCKSAFGSATESIFPYSDFDQGGDPNRKFNLENKHTSDKKIEALFFWIWIVTLRDFPALPRTS